MREKMAKCIAAWTRQCGKHLSLDDTVALIDGDHAGRQGTVVQIDKDTVTIRLTSQTLDTQEVACSSFGFNIPPDILVVGGTVELIDGEHNGKKGTVLRIEGERVLVNLEPQVSYMKIVCNAVQVEVLGDDKYVLPLWTLASWLDVALDELVDWVLGATDCECSLA